VWTYGLWIWFDNWWEWVCGLMDYLNMVFFFFFLCCESNNVVSVGEWTCGLWTMDYGSFKYGLIFLCWESNHIVSVGVWICGLWTLWIWFDFLILWMSGSKSCVLNMVCSLESLVFVHWFGHLIMLGNVCLWMILSHWLSLCLAMWDIRFVILYFKLDNSLI